MVIPNHSSQDDYERMNALRQLSGQMTAGSYMYIGPHIVCMVHDNYRPQCRTKNT